MTLFPETLFPTSYRLQNKLADGFIQSKPKSLCPMTYLQEAEILLLTGVQLP